MILINQEGNKSIKIEDSIDRTSIVYNYSDNVLSKLEWQSLLWQMNNMPRFDFPPLKSSYDTKKEYREALKKYEENEKEKIKEKEITNDNISKKRDKLYKSQQYYKILIDEETYAMYEDKEKAYKIYSTMFIAYSNDDKVFTLPKDEQCIATEE